MPERPRLRAAQKDRNCWHEPCSLDRVSAVDKAQALKLYEQAAANLRSPDYVVPRQVSGGDSGTPRMSTDQMRCEGVGGRWNGFQCRYGSNDQEIIQP